MRRLLVTASIVPSSPILVTLIKEALSSSETSVLTRATWRNIPEDAILHSHCHEKPQVLHHISKFSGSILSLEAGYSDKLFMVFFSPSQ
jgi:hypothetical protein